MCIRISRSSLLSLSVHVRLVEVNNMVQLAARSLILVIPTVAPPPSIGVIQLRRDDPLYSPELPAQRRRQVVAARHPFAQMHTMWLNDSLAFKLTERSLEAVLIGVGATTSGQDQSEWRRCSVGEKPVSKSIVLISCQRVAD